jgi:hypothetical protein
VVLLDTLLCAKTNLSHSTLDHTCFSNCSSWLCISYFCNKLNDKI